MTENNMWGDPNLPKILSRNGIAVMPTDTIYGVVGKAEESPVVERIYALRKRDPAKPCIILIGDIGELEKFSILLSPLARTVLASAKEPISFVLDCAEEKFAYLHRGTKTLAFRVPKNKDLQNLLKQTGPLIAPSANTEALPPSQTIAEAKKYFGSEVDLYIDGGEMKAKASKVIKLHKDGTIDVLRS